MCSCVTPRTVPVAFPGTFRSLFGGCLPTSPVGRRIERFSMSVLAQNIFSRVARTLGVAVTTIISVSNVVSATDSCFVPENLRVTSVEIGSQKRGQRLTRLSNRRRSARRQPPRRGRMIRWMILLNCTYPRTDCRPHPSKERMTGRPGSSTTQGGKTRQPPRLRLQISGLPHPMRSPARLSHPLCLWWIDPHSPTAHPGLGGQIATVHTVMSVVTEITIVDLLDVMSHPGHVTHPGIMRVESRPDPRPCWEGPAPGPSSRSKHSTAHPGSARASNKATDSRPSHHHHQSRAMVDHRSLPSPSCAMIDNRSLPEQHYYRRHEKDSTDHPGSTHVSRREIDLTTTVVDQPERRTITVIQSPARPASEDDSAGVTGLAEVTDSATGDDSARPADSAVVANPAEDDDSVGLPTRQSVMTRQLPTGQGGRPSRTECSSCDDSSKVADSSSARTWSKVFFWGWECDFSIISKRD